MAFSGLFPFCGTLVLALLTYGEASMSDEDTVGIVNEESNNLQEAVKELKEALKMQSSRFIKLEERLIKSEEKIALLLQERKINMSIINKLVPQSGLNPVSTGFEANISNQEGLTQDENHKIRTGILISKVI